MTDEERAQSVARLQMQDWLTWADEHQDQIICSEQVSTLYGLREMGPLELKRAAQYLVAHGLASYAVPR